jgi:hypothetical protein
MQFETVSAIEVRANDPHWVEDEIAPGVRISRRQILGVSGLALSWLALPASARAIILNDSSKAERERVEVVMAEIKRIADTLIQAADQDEEAYLAAISKLVRNMAQPAEPWFGWQKNGDMWAMDVAWYSQPVVLYQLKFDPGAKIELHDHRHYNGLLVGQSGSIEVRNFEPSGDSAKKWNWKKGETPADGHLFEIKETGRAVLRAGDQSTLTRNRDNLHVVQAGAEGGQCLDIFTHFNRAARSYELEWDAKENKERPGVFQAAYRKE